MKSFLERVSVRIQELRYIATKLDLRANDFLSRIDVEKIAFIKEKNKNWVPTSDYEKEAEKNFLDFHKTTLLVTTLSELMEVPILKGENGELNEDGYNKFQVKYRKAIDEI